MPVDLSTFREGFEAQGDKRFMVWTYSTTDRIGEVLKPGYFTTANQSVRVGDLVFLGTEPRTPSPTDKGPVGESRRALLMVTANNLRGVQVRLVQDYGGPHDPGPEPMALTPAPILVPSGRRSAARGG